MVELPFEVLRLDREHARAVIGEADPQPLVGEADQADRLAARRLAEDRVESVAHS